MDSNELFRMALGLAEPWRVAEATFSEERGRLDLRLEFPRGGRFACSSCGRGGCPVHDTEERTWRHLNFFEHEAYLAARQPRIRCPECGVKTVEVPWARPGAGFTLLMEAYILALAQGGMTAARIGRLVGEHDTLIWRVLRHYTEEARARADFSEVSTVGVDETSRAKGHSYVAVFMDLEPDRRRVLFVTPGKDAATVEAFAKDLEAHGGEPARIRRICMDMSAAFRKGAGEHLPEAEITFDPFHVAQLAGNAVDEVRRAERRERPELKGTRYLWLTNEWNQSDRQREAWADLPHRNLKTARAWRLKTALQDIFVPESRAEGEEMLRQWCAWAQRSRLAPMVAVARTLRRHWDGVLSWFDSRISNGVLEAINGLIQAIKRRARGFRNVDYLITMIYLHLGKLDLAVPAAF